MPYCLVIDYARLYLIPLYRFFNDYENDKIRK